MISICANVIMCAYDPMATKQVSGFVVLQARPCLFRSADCLQYAATEEGSGNLRLLYMNEFLNWSSVQLLHSHAY